MSEYIDKQAVLHEMKMDIRPPIAVVRDFPPADVRPVMYGKWILENNRPKSYMRVCSVCQKIAYFCTPVIPYIFCPNCGADMRGGKP